MSESAAAIDEKIRQQESEIESEVMSSQPLVGGLEPWSSLEQEYADNPSATFLVHIIELGKKYNKLRRIRRDGNCFYRAFLFSYLEYLMAHHGELQAFRDLVSKLAEDIVKVGYQSYIIQDMHEPFDELLKSINDDANFTAASLSEALNEQNYSNYYVAFLRVIVSYQLQKEEDFFINFIDLDQAASVRDFCTKEVEPMAKESDNIHLIALAHALNVSFRVESVDPRAQWQQDFGPASEADAPSEKPVLTLLFKPGHYDVIYPATPS